ncbi:MAG: glycerol kinase GlpK [Clostridiaceae bacterium]|nr:glycerol kinase GlpK [Clostridiaceae bacterium]
MSKKYILAIDQGTTSSRAILFDKEGKIASVARHEFTQIFPQNGWVEHDPMELLFSQMLAINEACESIGASESDIAAAGITNQRETVVLWDKETGRPVYNAIVWQCRRTADFCERLKSDGLEPLIAEKTGLIADAYFSGGKVRWILDNVPRARELLKKGRLLFGTIDTWLIWNLTGGKSHVTDYTNASRTMLFNINDLCWDKELCSIIGVPMEILPKVLSCSADFGTIASSRGLEAIAGVPIFGLAGDQHAALFGQGCYEAGQAKNTYGTGCFLLMNTGEKRVRSGNRLLSTIAWGVDGKVEYALEGSVFNAGSVIKWLRDDLRIIDSSAQCSELAASVKDAGGLYIVPAFTGLGAPYWDMYARGAMYGLSRATGRAQIARAVIEAIAYQVKDLIIAMEKDSEIMLNELRADGGASQSDVLMQFQADMLGVRIDRPESIESTALGAALLAGLKCEFWSGMEEVNAIRKSQRIFEPLMDKKERENKYSCWLKAVRSTIENGHN